MPHVPKRYWRSYGTEPLPTPQEALGQPFVAFPSWFLRIECDRCHKVQWINQVHMRRSDLPLRTILARMRHEHCGGKPAKAELLTGTEAASNGPVGLRAATMLQSSRSASSNFASPAPTIGSATASSSITSATCQAVSRRLR